MINPSKPEDYDPNLTEADIFNSLGMTEEEYYNALSISIQTLICTLKDHWIAVLSIIITNGCWNQGICCQCGLTTSP